MASSSAPRWEVHHRTVTILLAVVIAVDLISCASLAVKNPVPDRSSGRRKWGTLPLDNGVRDREDRERIIGGGQANRTAFPYIVMITIWKDNEEYTCGGTLIDRQYVVTAAHCVLSSSTLVVAPSAITVYAGTLEVKKGQKVGVAQVWSHPSFSFYANDVALLKLRSALKISATVMPIKLSFDDSPLVNGADLTISGWGSITSDGFSTASRLMAATVNHLPSGCAKYKKPDTSEYVAGLMICAGCSVGRVDTCQGDSGGPLTVVSASKGCPILAGFTSFGEGCAQPEYPGVYARASAQVAWLEKQAGRVFRSQYAMAPTAVCDTCAGVSKGKCGLTPAFDAYACQIEAYLATAMQLRVKTCSRGTKAQAGGSLPLEALFNPSSFGKFKPKGSLFFIRARSEGSSRIKLGGVMVNVPFKAPVESRNGTAFSSYWRFFWLPDAAQPNRTCSNYYAYAAAFISSDKKYIQVTHPVRP